MTIASDLIVYGSDVRCTIVGGVPDIDPTFAVDTGGRAVMFAVIHAILGQAGSYWWDESLGADIQDMQNAVMTEGSVRWLMTRMKSVAEADERVYEATVTATALANSLKVRILLTLINGSTAPEFTLSVDAVGVNVLVS